MTAPLFTSNSNQRLPPGPWMKTWILACGLVVIFFSGIELYARTRGSPSKQTKDTPALWAENRRLASAVGRKALIFIGSSRCEAGVKLDAFKQDFSNCEPLQLSINGTSAMPIFENLANDESVNGTIIFEFYPGIIHRLNADPEHVPREWVAKYESGTITSAQQKSEAWIKGNIRLAAFQNRQYAPAQLASRLFGIEGDESLKPIRYELLPDRSLLIDFSNYNSEEAAASAKTYFHALRLPQNVDGLRPIWLRVREAARKIRAHGGQVVIVYFPSGKTVRALEESHMPRKMYWDRLVVESGAIGIHYLDYPELAQYDCPDFGHLDRKDAGPFSRDLSAIMRKKLQATVDASQP
jgi:hypothetical protein